MNPPPLNILVTGGSGFVGEEVIPVLRSAGHRVIAVNRQSTFDDADGLGPMPPLGDIAPDDLDQIDAIVHLAGLAHRGKADEETFDEVNHLLAVRLAQAAVAAGVSRFVQASTSKVHGSSSAEPISSGSPFIPTDGYSGSKIDAERSLEAIAGPMTITALRPPLIFGPSAKGNVHLIRMLLRRGIPVPVSTKGNVRSFLSRNDFAHAVLSALSIDSGSYQGFVLDDGQPMSSSAFYQIIADADGIPLRVLPLPRMAFTLLDCFAQRFKGCRPLEASYADFVFECSAFRDETGWTPQGLVSGNNNCLLGQARIWST